jgi:hypothetical protein
MAENDMEEPGNLTGNKNIVLIMGKPNTGKSTSLMYLKNQERFAYLNADLKELPFKSRFAANIEISDAQDVLGYIDSIEEEPEVDGGILDTLTFLMQMYERQYVTPYAGTKSGQAAWGGYGDFYRNVIHKLKSGTKDYAILAHAATQHDEENFSMETAVPIKGAVGRTGVEADFTTILSTKQMPIKKLQGFENDLLHITDEEKEDGFKFVFVTRITKDTIGEKMRSAMGLWDRKELYIDNDLNQVFQRLKDYYK